MVSGASSGGDGGADDPELERLKRKKLQDMISAQRGREQGQQQQQQQQHHQHPETRRGVTSLSSATFARTVSSPRPTLVDFWAQWCGPCRAMHPIFEDLSDSYPGIAFARVNVDECPDVAARLSISSIPTFVMFRSGAPVSRVAGAVGRDALDSMCRAAAAATTTNTTADRPDDAG